MRYSASHPVGKIYGVTFIDHKAGIVANGSLRERSFRKHFQ